VVLVAVHRAPFMSFGTSCAFWLMRLAAQCRGVVYNIFADIEDTEKCFHVPATSSEAPSTSDGVAGTWKRFSASSTSAMRAWGSWGGGVVASWQVEGVWVGSEQAGGIDRALRYDTKKAY